MQQLVAAQRPLLRARGACRHTFSSSSSSSSSMVTSSRGGRRRSGAAAAAAPTPSAAAATVPDVYRESGDPELARLQEHQKAAARPTPAEDARTLMALAPTGVLSTISSHAGSKGFPFGSVVEYAVDAQGRPLLSTSTLSPHTADLLVDGRASLTVTAPGFKSLQDARFTLTGAARELTDAAARAAAREAYLARHPNAFYVDFGDFKWFCLDDLAGGRFVGGFGRVASVAAADYLAAAPDPVAGFGAHVCAHMNAEDSHARDMADMVWHSVGGLAVEKARMLGVDRLGADLSVTRGGQEFKLRLPFVRPAEDRAGLKAVLVDMTKAARAARAAAAAGGGASSS